MRRNKKEHLIIKIMHTFCFYLFFILNVLFCIGGARFMAVGKTGAVSVMDNLFVASCVGVSISVLLLYSYKKLLIIKQRLPEKYDHTGRRILKK